MSTHVLKVEVESAQLRLDVFLTQRLTDPEGLNFSRGEVQELIEKECVLVNGKILKSSYKVAVGDEIVVDALRTAAITDDSILPEDIKLDIVYEDADVLVVNKKSGMMVHPAQGIRSQTLVNALLFHCSKLSNLNTEERPGIVHRLDQDTSGVMVVAKNNRAHKILAEQFEQHQIVKHYVALVEGVIEFDEGLIEAPLGRHFKHREKKMVAYDDGAKEAETLYKVIKRYKKATYVGLYPKTGRTHQLRVHMAHLGHPILGDDKYGNKSLFPRLALHAQSLGFVHPKFKTFVEFCVKPPKEFLNYKD